MCCGEQGQREITLKIEGVHLPGFSDCITFNRVSIELNGEFIELVRTPDCQRHFVTRDRTRHFCIWWDEIRELPRRYEQILYCGQVCEYMKAIYQREIDQHGQWLSEKALAFMQSYLEKKNTVDLYQKGNEQ